MAIIKIDADYANGWNREQDAFISELVERIKADPKHIQEGRSLGRCESETTIRNDNFSVTYRIDSSD